MKEHTYIAIDLKSFYASVECAERHLNPLTTNLVVADASRTEKTICLAVSPSLKAFGISGRARLFEVVQRVREVNAQRLAAAVSRRLVQRGEDGQYHFSSSSFSSIALADDPALELAYITAPPRMRLYEEYSTRIYGIYLKYIAPEDIHVYSIDEVFMDVTHYLNTYGMDAHELAMTMIREVLYTTGITATAGIGTNLYLAKVAMDIVAKHVPADKDGVRIAFLDEMRYRQLLWDHTPLTDFWRIGHGYIRKLASVGLYTMGDIARCSLGKANDFLNEDLLYRIFGINAELLIDHAWGWEPVTISDIKAYRPSSNSLSSGQVLHCPYDFEKGKLIVREMTELLVLDLVNKKLVTSQLVLSIGYDKESLEGERGRHYHGEIHYDHYGRAVPKHAHGTVNLSSRTSSGKKIVSAVIRLYEEIVDPSLLIRRLNVVACNLTRESEPDEPQYEQMNLFTDYEAIARQKEADEREKRMQKAVLELQQKFGKNAVLKGMNLQDGATTIQRNAQIGGHKAE